MSEHEAIAAALDAASIVEQSSDAILTIGPSGRIVTWNRGAERIYGYRADEMIGRNAATVLAPSGGDDGRDGGLSRPDDGESPTGRELILIRADGRLITVSVTTSPIVDADGRLVAISSISRDISDQKVVEAALRDHEAKTAASLDHMLDGFAILRSVRAGGEIIDFAWTYINPAGAAASGVGVADLIGERVMTMQPSMYDAGLLDELRHVVETGEVLSSVHRICVDEKMVAVFDYRAWKLDDGIACTWRDVTDRELALAAVQTNEEKFRALIENLHEALSVYVAIRDKTGRIVDFRWEFRNSAAVELTGFSDEAMAGRTLLQLLPAHGPNGLFAVYCNIVETGEPYVDSSLWIDQTWGDGRRRRRAFEVRATKLDDGFVILSREVTQQREQESELARQRLELERSNTEMSLLNELADRLQSCATADEAYSVATQSCAVLFPALSGSISVMQPSRDVLQRKTAWGDSFGAVTFGAADCWAVLQGSPHLSGPSGARCEHLSACLTLACLCVPMMGPSSPAGVIQVMSTFPEHDLENGPTRRLAVVLAGQLSMAFANLHLRDSLREMSIRDPLTGLFNRRYMEETLKRELSQAARDNTELGILVIDVDHFKAFNDSHGHDGGDAVLEAVGELLTRYSRSSDVACRFGGEEFIVILPNCSLRDASLRADGVRRRVSALRVPHHGAELPGPTISCGVAAFPGHGSTADGLIRMADKALYLAKTRGRDQVVVAPLDDAVVDDASAE